MLNRKKKRGWLLSLFMVFVVALAGCSVFGAENPEETTLEKVRREGYVTVGFANEKPYAYMNSDRELTGVSVEIARTIMENLGVGELRGVLTEFASLIPGLQAKRFDMVTAGMFITPDRAAAEAVQFANPEFTIGEALAVETGNPLDLHSYEDIAENDEALVAVPSGTIEYDYLIQSGVPEDRIVTVPDLASALSAIQSERADAITATQPALQATLDTAGDESIERVEDFQQPVIDGNPVQDYGATVFREADQEFIAAWNEELRKLEESGELLRILEEFGFTEENLPQGVTAEEAVE